MKVYQVALDDVDISNSYVLQAARGRGPLPDVKWVHDIKALLEDYQSEDVIVVSDLDRVQLVEWVAKKSCPGHVRVMTEETWKELCE